MAERLKEKLLDEERIVDLVVGPDAYKDLPNLIKEVDEDGKRPSDNNIDVENVDSPAKADN